MLDPLFRRCYKMQKYMLTASDVSAILDIKTSKAYEVIRLLNTKLQQKGILTVRGRVPRHYLYESYGLRED